MQIQPAQFLKDPRAAAQATRSSPLVPGTTSPMPRYYDPHGPNPGPQQPLQRVVAPPMVAPDMTVPRPLPGSSFPPYTPEVQFETQPLAAPQRQTGPYGWRKRTRATRRRSTSSSKTRGKQRKSYRLSSNRWTECELMREGQRSCPPASLPSRSWVRHRRHHLPCRDSFRPARRASTRWTRRRLRCRD